MSSAGRGRVQPIARLEMQRQPGRAQSVRQALGLPHHRLRPAIGPNQRQHPVPGRPDALHAMRPHVGAHILVHILRRPPQPDLAQRGQVALAEKTVQRPRRHVRPVDLPVAQPAPQLRRRQIDELDLVRHLHHPVRQRLRHPHPRDARNIVVQALQMLHVQRGPHVDAGLQQLRHILPTLVVPAPRRIGVRQLIHQQQPGMARQRRIHIELLQHLSPIRDGAARQQRQIGNLPLGPRPPMRLHHPDQHVPPGRPGALGRGQHLPRLAHARGGAQEHLQATPVLAGGGGEESVRVGARGVFHGGKQGLLF